MKNVRKGGKQGGRGVLGGRSVAAGPASPVIGGASVSLCERLRQDKLYRHEVTQRLCRKQAGRRTVNETFQLGVALACEGLCSGSEVQRREGLELLREVLWKPSSVVMAEREDGYWVMNVVLLMEGDKESVLLNARRATEDCPEKATTWRLLALVLLWDRETSEAADCLDRAAKCEGGDTEDSEYARRLRDVAGGVLAIPGIVGGLIPEARVYRDWRYEMHRLAADEGKCSEVSLGVYLRLFPDSTGLEKALALLKMAKGDFDEAFELAEELAEQGERTVDGWRIMGLLAFECEGWWEAASDFERVLEIEPSDEYAVARLSTALMRMEKTERALTILATFMDNYASGAQVFAAYGTALSDLGEDHDRAVEYHLRAKAKAVEEGAQLRCDVIYDRLMVYIRAWRVDLFREEWEAASVLLDGAAMRGEFDKWSLSSLRFVRERLLVPVKSFSDGVRDLVQIVSDEGLKWFITPRVGAARLEEIWALRGKVMVLPRAQQVAQMAAFADVARRADQHSLSLAAWECLGELGATDLRPAYERAQCLIHMGRTDEALALMRANVGTEPSLRYDLGQDALKQGKLEEALAEFLACVEEAGKGEERNKSLASAVSCAIYLQDWAQADRLFEKYVEEVGVGERTAVWEVERQFYAGNVPGALDLLASFTGVDFDAIELDSEESSFIDMDLQPEVMWYVGFCGFWTPGSDLAERMYAVAESLDCVTDAWVALYAEYLRREGRQEEAGKLLFENEGVSWDVVASQGLYFADLNDWDRVQRVGESLTVGDSDIQDYKHLHGRLGAIGHVLLGMRARAAGDLQSALSRADVAVGLDRLCGLAHRLRVEVLRSLGRWAEADAALEEAKKRLLWVTGVEAW
jgi:tetratricopeptide (TPR) repeat protein